MNQPELKENNDELINEHKLTKQEIEYKEMEKSCELVIESLLACGINFLAIDFDDTLVAYHTLGRWTGSSSELATKLRPFFKILLPLAHANGILMAIVTFSPQTDIIHDILLQEFPDFADKIPIRGDDNSWNYDGRGAKEGKQKHMASAAEQLWENSGNIITRKSTLLLDDDKNNIVIARKNEVQAVLIEPNNIQKSIKSLQILKELVSEPILNVARTNPFEQNNFKKKQVK